MKIDVTKIKETQGIKIVQQPINSAPAGSFVQDASKSKDTMVGFDEDLIQIMDTLTGDESNLQILPIVGMGGIGKTTLAKNVFDNPVIANHFDLHAWVTISQQYSVHEILLGLLKNIRVLAGRGEEIARENDEELRLRLHRSLFGRRYFIVMDDMWSIEVWDGIKRFFPDNNNGSRVMVTTRLTNVANGFHSCAPHQLHFLHEDQSWVLFCDKVFGKESCPPEFEKVGKTIVRNCGALPLAIVVISGLLAKSSRTIEYWEYVANHTHAALNMGGDGLCFEILSLSYKHLPVHLKPCFLYMAIFPEDSRIKISKLFKLWVADGILKPKRCRSLEEIAEDNLKDLIDRNLIQVHDYGSRNRIKTCAIHDLLRDLCLGEAQKEKFICVNMRHNLNNQIRIIDNKRRLIINQSFDEELCQQHFIEGMNLASCTRSLICSKLKYTLTKLLICSRLLRVLRTDDLYSCKVIPQLVNSRYIEFVVPFDDHNRIVWSPLESISLLWNLQSITISGYNFTEEPIKLPGEIWEMPQLRHLRTVRANFCLPDPQSTDSPNTVLKNLQTLYTTRNLRCTDEVVGRIPNLKKLGIIFLRWDDSEVYNLTPLTNLETLFLGGEFDVLKNFCFPRSLKKLTLTWCNMSWEDLTVVGAMPQLEVLKLMYGSIEGREWNPVEGQFLELKSLLIRETNLQKWIADSSHFPSLEKLQLESVECLEEIPQGIGDIPTLGSISVVLCNESVNSSAMKIQEDQQNLGNYDLQVVVKGLTLRPLERSRAFYGDNIMNFQLDI